ncbi:MAG: tetratricopeptide repeat protein [Candidatus Riflebacteria bacterium]|nr:tetratricopeptide repeat protein [Candidatus Riflebacteria bacterium]
MKKRNSVLVDGNIATIKLDIYASIWEDILVDNIVLMAEKSERRVRLFSMNTGEERFRCDLDNKYMDLLNAAPIKRITNSSYPDSEIYRFEPFDLSGTLIDAFEAQTRARYDVAAGLYQKLADSGFKLGYVYNLMGLCLKQTGKLKEALAAYNKALELEKESAPIYSNIAKMYEKSEHPEQAEKLYEAALMVNPFHYGSLIKYANYLLTQKRYDNNVNIILFNNYLRLKSTSDYFADLYDVLEIDKEEYEANLNARTDMFSSREFQDMQRRLVNKINNLAFRNAAEDFVALIQHVKNSQEKTKGLEWCKDRMNIFEQKMHSYPEKAEIISILFDAFEDAEPGFYQQTVEETVGQVSEKSLPEIKPQEKPVQSPPKAETPAKAPETPAAKPIQTAAKIEKQPASPVPAPQAKPQAAAVKPQTPSQPQAAAPRPQVRTQAPVPKQSEPKMPELPKAAGPQRKMPDLPQTEQAKPKATTTSQPQEQPKRKLPPLPGEK